MPQESKGLEHSGKGNRTVADLKALWIDWLIGVSKGTQPILSTVIIFAVYILGDYFVIWLAGLAFADAIESVSFLRFLYTGIKIVSVIILTFHFFGEYAIEFNENRKFVVSKILKKPMVKKEAKAK